ncbi:MAG: SGNH/GDSL hydrolase family protein [Moraxellaceae bacterium]
MRAPRAFLFYGMTVFVSCLLALVVAEVVLRHIDYTTGTGMGKAYERWAKKNWAPLNEAGLRDFGISPRMGSMLPRIYFLGDSFTAGHGVRFEDGYYYRAHLRLLDKYTLFNLSRNGASTRSELGEIQHFNIATSGSARVVVHQYYFNDIDDYVSLPRWIAPPWLERASRQLALAELLLVYRFNAEWGGQYGVALKAAYDNPEILARHLQDVAQLHQFIRQQGGSVVFLVFPPLATDELMNQHAAEVGRMREFFAKTCQPGDEFIDATAAARTLSRRARVVNFVDSHPSPKLHALIAEEVVQATEHNSGGAHESCVLLRRSIHERSAVVPVDAATAVRHRTSAALSAAL